MNFLVILLLVGVSQITGKCPDDCKESNFLYESFQCTPICEDNDCPVGYNCSSITQHDDMCFYNGNHYKKEAKIENSLTWEHCMGCTCEENDENTVDFICYSAHCATHIATDRENCVFKQTLGECCASEFICPPFSECVLEGKVFSEDGGKFIHPTDNCTKCTCERSTEDEGGIRCQKQYCNDLLLHQGDIKKMCAPFYDNLDYDCCPWQWICPENKFTFDEMVQTDKGPSCMFGDKILNKAQKGYADLDIGKVVCECIMPPFATCSLV